MDESKLDELISKVSENVEKSKELMKSARETAKEVSDYPNKLETTVYLEAQDKLSVTYDYLLEYYETNNAILKDLDAICLLLVKSKYDTVGKKVNQAQMQAEARLMYSEASLGTSLTESYQKAVRNYISAFRAHINALTGKETNISHE